MDKLTIKEIEELAKRLDAFADGDVHEARRDALLGIHPEQNDYEIWADLMTQAASALRHLLNERKWRPIWTPEQVSNLHAWQRADHVHPFTCPHRDDHLVIDGDKGILIPTVRGWICQFCDYTQDWAHSSMLSGPHNMPLPLPPSPEENGDV